MKNLISLIIISFSILFCFSGCQKSPINGDLDGMWQIVSIDPEPDDGPFDPSQLYYNFSLHVCQLSTYGGTWINGLMNFDSDILTIDFSSFNVPDQQLKLRQYGINSDNVTFTVELLNRKSLVLRDGDTVITLRKF